MVVIWLDVVVVVVVLDCIKTWYDSSALSYHARKKFQGRVAKVVSNNLIK